MKTAAFLTVALMAGLVAGCAKTDRPGSDVPKDSAPGRPAAVESKPEPKAAEASPAPDPEAARGEGRG